MAWKVHIGAERKLVDGKFVYEGGKSMLLDDLTPEDFSTVCANHPGVNWLRLYSAPASDPGALYDLLCVVARKLEMPSPDRPQTVKDAVGLLAYVEQVDDDLPTAFGEGGIPPEGPAETGTISSSTSTGPEAGTPTEPDGQLSAI